MPEACENNLCSLERATRTKCLPTITRFHLELKESSGRSSLLKLSADLDLFSCPVLSIYIISGDPQSISY